MINDEFFSQRDYNRFNGIVESETIRFHMKQNFSVTCEHPSHKPHSVCFSEIQVSSIQDAEKEFDNQGWGMVGSILCCPDCYKEIQDKSSKRSLCQ